MTRIQTEKRSLPTELTPEELAAESQKLADAVKEADKQKDAIAEKTGLWKETKKKMDGYLAHLESEVTALATVVDSGVADREVECSWLYSLRQGYGFLVRDDTGELVTHRRLGDQERQENLLEVLREPTEEQLKEWTESLGLVLDPQQDLELAAPANAGDDPAYYRVFVLAGEHGQERITARFSEADHRPSSLSGVYVHPDAEPTTGLPEQVDRSTLAYEDDPETIRTYRQALEDLLETKRQEALKSRSSGEDAPPVPPPPGRSRRRPLAAAFPGGGSGAAGGDGCASVRPAGLGAVADRRWRQV